MQLRRPTELEGARHYCAAESVLHEIKEHDFKLTPQPDFYTFDAAFL
jgi:hypothetical protein